MCRMSALAATALVPVLVLAAPALAKPAAKPPVAAAAAEAPRKASPADRAMAQRLDPLARAAFWAREVDTDPMDAEAGLALSQALRGLGRYDEAIASAQRVQLARPNDVEALLELARNQRLRVEQDAPGDPIRMTLAPEAG